MNKNSYGKELILDLHHCDPTTFTRKSIENFFTELCKKIDMEKCELFFWDDHGLPPEECQTEPHLKGTSAVQFIMTSNITIHTLDIMKRVYLNIFSCKDFSHDVAMHFCVHWFKAREIAQNKVIDRI